MTSEELVCPNMDITLDIISFLIDKNCIGSEDFELYYKEISGVKYNIIKLLSESAKKQETIIRLKFL
jgi:hypothetical protein